MSPIGVGALYKSTNHGIRRINMIQLGKLIRSRQFSVVSREYRMVKRNGKVFLSSKFGDLEKRDLMILNPTGKHIRARNESAEPIAEFVRENKVEQLQEILRNLELRNTATANEVLNDVKEPVESAAEERLEPIEAATNVKETGSTNPETVKVIEEPTVKVEPAKIVEKSVPEASTVIDEPNTEESIVVGEEPANVGQSVTNSAESELDESITRSMDEPAESSHPTPSSIMHEIEDLVKPTETIETASKVTEKILNDAKIPAIVREKSANVIQSKSGAFTMNITNAEESDVEEDGDDTSSSSDSSSDSSSSDSEDDIPPPTEKLGRTSLDKISELDGCATPEELAARLMQLRQQYEKNYQWKH